MHAACAGCNDRLARYDVRGGLPNVVFILNWSTGYTCLIRIHHGLEGLRFFYEEGEHYKTRGGLIECVRG